MRSGEWGDQYIAQRHRRGQSHTALIQTGQPETKRFQRPGRGTDGAVRSFEQRLQSGDVVGVGVGDEDGGQIRRGQAQLFQRFGDAAAGDARITSRWVVSQENSSAFPEEPLARVCRVVKEKTSLKQDRIKNGRPPGKCRPTSPSPKRTPNG